MCTEREVLAQQDVLARGGTEDEDTEAAPVEAELIADELNHAEQDRRHRPEAQGSGPHRH